MLQSDEFTLEHHAFTLMFLYVGAQLFSEPQQAQEILEVITELQKYISNSWGKHKANQYHDGDFIPDETYWRQKEY